MDDTTQATPPKKKGRGLVMTLIVVIVLLLCAGGGGAWWLLEARSGAAAAEPDPETRGLLAFEPFLVNLTDAGGNRFLKVTVQLVVGTADEAKHVEETPVILMRARSSILELLAQQSASALVTPEGKQALKLGIKERVTPLLAHEQVIDVLFSEFVVQF
jgi:flagellar FliL protein